MKLTGPLKVRINTQKENACKNIVKAILTLAFSTEIRQIKFINPYPNQVNVFY